MDDLLKSFSHEENLKILTTSLILALENCSFQFTKWLSNSHYVLKPLSHSELSPKLVKIELYSQPVKRILGISWDIKYRTFAFRPIKKVNQ